MENLELVGHGPTLRLRLRSGQAPPYGYVGIAGAIMRNWLEYFRAKGPEILDVRKLKGREKSKK